MKDWKAEAEKLRFDEGKEWAEVAAGVKHMLPNTPETKLIDKVRRALRNRDRYKREMPQSQSPLDNYKETVKLNSDGTKESDRLIEIGHGQEITPELLLKAHNLNPDEWEITSYRNNYWHSQVRGGKRMVMYQSKVTCKPKKDGLSLKHIDRHFKKLDRTHFIPQIKQIKKQGNMMAEVNIADLHLGKLCWHGDTGNNYDYKIARDIFNNVISDVYHELALKPLEYIIFVWSNDFFNSDTITNTTTAGTQMHNDVRWQKLFNVGVEMLVNGITMLSQIAPVKTFYTPSNHDEVNGYHALKYLEAWFRKDRNVQICTDAKPRQYHLYGVTLLGYGHGDKEKGKGSKEKASRLASCMPIEVPHLWAKAKFREFHAGHLHSEQMIQEINGVIVRRISAPTANDTWHTQSGYIGSTRKAQTFIYDKARGLRHIFNTPVGEYKGVV